MTRVVLYTEGAGESLGDETRLPASLEPLEDAHLGPAHELVRRAIARARALDVASIRFLAPLTLRGRTARGSDLHDPTAVRRLLAFVRTKPDLAIVLVDGDGDASEKRRRLSPILSGRAVHAVAIEEFEGWLITDVSAASRSIGRALDEAPEPDGLPRRRAKEHWDEWTAALSPAERARARREVARTLDLDVAIRRSKSFSRFVDDLCA